MEIEVPKGEHGLVRLFSLSYNKKDATRLSTEPEALADALGVGMLDIGGTQIVPIDVLDDLGLFGYLIEGVGLTEDQLLTDKRKIDALEGFALVVRSSAFNGLRQVMALQPEITLIGTYKEPGVASSFQKPLESESAEAYSGTPQEAATKAALSARGRIPWGLTLALLAVALVLFGLAFFGLGSL